MAIMSIIFAVIVPQLRVSENSWDSKVGSSETLQNGRILIDHINRNLSKATRITAVSDSAETNGYIEFIDNDANNVRYAINAINDYVEFGPNGGPNDIAGPVSKLQFTCYDANDFSTPITDVNAIRSVKVETTVINSARLDQDMTFSTQAYIRTNALLSPPEISKLSEPWLIYDPVQGEAPALLQINPTKYLCAYQGLYAGGSACILMVNNSDWTVSKGPSVQYDADYADKPSLAKIDASHFLCAYEGYRGDGWVCVLAEESNTLVLKSSLEFDTKDGLFPALYQLDATHYLCAYQCKSVPVATILTVDTLNWSITNGTPITFDSLGGTQPTLEKVDDTHYLCVYNGYGNGGAIILTIDTVNWTIVQEVPLHFETDSTENPALAKVDDTHYICTYTLGNQNIGWGVILTVNTSNNWTITQETPVELESVDFLDSALCKINNTDFLCGYTENSPGRAVVLTVNTSDWTITKGTMLDFETAHGGEPALCQIDSNHYLCAYYDVGSSGIAGVLELGAEIRP